jgi:hypothetical protein
MLPNLSIMSPPARTMLHHRHTKLPCRLRRHIERNGETEVENGIFAMEKKGDIYFGLGWL